MAKRITCSTTPTLHKSNFRAVSAVVYPEFEFSRKAFNASGGAYFNVQIPGLINMGRSPGVGGIGELGRSGRMTSHRGVVPKYLANPKSTILILGG
jgi:hypothetical protein